MSTASTAYAGTFLESALAEDSDVTPFHEFRAWFQEQRELHKLDVRPIPFHKLDRWKMDGSPLRLWHESGKFFSIDGLRVETDFGPVPEWDQPIIRQPEIGILGAITKSFGGVRHFLMQAKVEPGNVNGVQLSPTEQATRSNFTRAHGGLEPAYHKYFADSGRYRVLVDRLQGEQGSRFLRKRNRNMIVEVTEDVAVLPGFCWLTLGQIQRLLRQDNLVNMDARSVLSCIPLSEGLAAESLSLTDPDGLLASLDGCGSVHSEREILNWLHKLRSSYDMRIRQVPLDQLNHWSVSEDEIYHASGRYFSVMAVEVEGRTREVKRWSQPLLQHSGGGLNGFVVQRLNGVLHFLVRACMYPGNWELFELGSTVSRSNADHHFGKPGAPAFLDLFHNPPESWVRYNAVQSEEGGRFYHYQNRYMVVEVPSDWRLDPPENFCWMTLGQVQKFVQHGYFNIEGRNLLACIGSSQRRHPEDDPI